MRFTRSYFLLETAAAQNLQPPHANLFEMLFWCNFGTLGFFLYNTSESSMDDMFCLAKQFLVKNYKRDPIFSKEGLSGRVIEILYATLLFLV